jgi:phytoene dehydrogenase-like protein
VHDLALGGTGPAGIATACLVRDLGLDVVVFEAGDDVGGRMLTIATW